MDRFVDRTPHHHLGADSRQHVDTLVLAPNQIRAQTQRVIQRVLMGEKPNWHDTVFSESENDKPTVGRESTQPQEIAGHIIDIYHLTNDKAAELRKLSALGKTKEIVSKLPPTIDLRLLDDTAARFLRYLLTENGGEGIAKLHFTGLHEEISSDVAALLSVVMLKTNEVFKEFKKIKNVSQPSEGFRNLVVRIRHQWLVSDRFILKKLVSYPHLTDISQETGDMLAHMINNGFYRGILRLLPKKIELTNVSDGFLRVVRSLLNSSYLKSKVIEKRLVPLQSTSDLTPGIDLFLETLLQADELTASMLDLDAVNLVQLKPDTGRYLEKLVAFNPSLADKLLDQSHGVLDLDSMDYHLSRVLVACARNGTPDKLLGLIPDGIEVNQLSDDAVFLLITLVRLGCSDAVIMKFGQLQNLGDLRSSTGDLLALLCKNDHDDVVFSWFPDSLGSEFFSHGTTSLLNALSTEKRNSLLKRVRLAEVVADIRRPISPDHIATLSHPNGWYLFQTVGFLGNKISPIIERPNGWLKTELNKDGSQTYIFAHRTGGTVDSVVFQNQGIGRRGMQALYWTHHFIPGFVSSSNYPEVSEDGQTSQLLFQKTGYREVFAGPSLSTLSKDQNQSDPLSQSIFTQVTFIKQMLVLLGVDHGHTHRGNFNVRYLLVGENGERILSFDANMAIQLAQKDGLSIVPIVILRDWDQAKINEDARRLLHHGFGIQDKDFNDLRGKLTITAALGQLPIKQACDLGPGPEETR